MAAVELDRTDLQLLAALQAHPLGRDAAQTVEEGLHVQSAAAPLARHSVRSRSDSRHVGTESCTSPVRCSTQPQPHGRSTTAHCRGRVGSL
jgi:hypothetical protein